MGAGPAWIGYIHAADVDAKTDSVKAAGGKVHRAPEDIPNVGRFSVVADPQGAMFMLLAPARPRTSRRRPAARSAMSAGASSTPIGWEKALDFYSSQFGWTKDQSIDMGEMGTYQLFAIDGEQAGGMMNQASLTFPIPCWGFYFNVSGIDAAAARVTGNGGQILIRTDGGARRQLDRQLHGPAGRGILADQPDEVRFGDSLLSCPGKASMAYEFCARDKSKLSPGG